MEVYALSVRRLFAGVLFLITCTGFQINALAVEEPPQVHFVIRGFNVTGDNPLSKSETDNILSPFLGDHYGLEGLQAAVDALEQAFSDKGFSFYRVNFVPQDLRNGVVSFSVSEFKLGAVQVTGNNNFSEANIRRSLPGLKAGSVPNTRVLSRSLHMNNSQPSKKLTVKFAGSETEDVINAQVKVVDQSPGFFFLALNNTGSDETGKFRVTAGYQYSNLFDRDHSATISYTTSPDKTEAVNQYGLSYNIPFYSLGSRLSFLYSNSDVDSGIIANQFAVSGKGSVFSMRYLQNFLQLGIYKHELEFGADLKKFDNDVSLGGTSVTGSGAGQVASHPVSFIYRGALASTRTAFDFSLGLSRNISGGTNNEDADYENARTGATADWQTITYGMSFSWFFTSQWRALAKLSGQESGDVLISGEQYGLGGRNSIRGFDERALLGDKGYQINLELWLPSFTSYQIYPLVFYDFGQIENNQPATGELTKENPASAGAGLRWYWRDSLSVILDVGIVTSDIDIIETDSARGHIDVFYRF